MRHRKFLAAAIALAVGTGMTLAADETVEDRQPMPETPVLTPNPEASTATAPLFWVSADYLKWWIKPGPLRAPLVTTGNPLDPVPGALAQPGTRILNDDDIDFHSMHGLRILAGAWLDDDATFGVEAGGFYLSTKAGSGLVASTALAGGTGIYIPALRPDLGRPGALTISDPVSGFAGVVGVSTDAALCGAELNLIHNWARGECISIDVLTGVRYINLQEHLSETGLSRDLILLNDFTFTDRFTTSNRFYGGQVGAQGTVNWDWFFASVRGTLAIGANEESVQIDGSSRLTGTATGNFVGGFFSQPSNVGHRSSTDLSVIPQLSLKMGINCFGCATIFAGYDCLYWCRTVRPGNQIDSRVDTPISLGGSAPIQRTPLPLFERSDFWAQGFSLGFSVQY
jgi:hypothetical protein